MSNQIIKCLDYLNPDASIEDKKEIIYKRKEIEDINDKIGGYLLGESVPQLTLISGCSGSGKTLTVLHSLYAFLEKNQKLSSDFIYVDGNRWRTPKTMLKYISDTLGGAAKGDQIPYYIENITNQINNRNRRLLIIIDEVDKIFKNSRESPKYLFLHSLNRMNTNPRHSILMITNEFNFSRTIQNTSDNSELSSSITELTFNAYNCPDMIEILKKRAQYCLEEGTYREEDLAQISKEAYQNPVGGDHANARHAITILQTAAVLSQKAKSPLIAKHINEAIERVRLNNYIKLLSKYNTQILLLIHVLAEEQQKKKTGIYKYANPQLTYDDIKTAFYTHYKEENTTKEPSERTLQNYIEQLIKEKLLRRLNRSNYSFQEHSAEILKAIEQISHQQMPKDRS